ncbi:MAG: hypothetical protein IPL61_37055 [Myxococcales bacterium]|nr:hypothetical protein [Myxococcales bacterium]
MRTRARSVLLTLALGALTTAGCTTSPLNGTTVSGSGVFKSFTFTGYYNVPNTTIRLDVMKNPTLDPGLNSSWEAFAVAQTTNIPIEVNSPG